VGALETVEDQVKPDLVLVAVVAFVPACDLYRLFNRDRP
jgi:hypothetical protein